ncbi:MAG: autotransporter outer membrane beta-barrel domain-containing protein [Ketobacter sp.]|nr:MAG: autotransporter outer membrane beta-barrel domain-containing protein [Ketobacter sp.]
MDFTMTTRTALCALLGILTFSQTVQANQNQDNFEQEIDTVCDEVFQNEDDVCFSRTDGDSTVTAQVTPEEESALYTSLVQISGDQVSNVSNHLVGLRRQRNASSTNSASSAAILPNYYGGAAGGELFANSRLSAFFSASTVDGDQDHTDYEVGYDLSTDHYTLGVDLQLNPEWLLGLAYGTTETELKYSSEFDDRTENDSDHYLLYASWYRRNFAVDMTVGYSNGEFKTQRQLPDALATGTTDNDMMYVSLSGAYDFSQGGWTYGPLAKFDYLDGQIDGFAEQGDSAWKAEFDDQDVQSSIFTMGGQVAYAHSFNWGVVLPYAQGVWRYELEDERDLIVGRFSVNPGEDFTITPDEPDSSWFEVSAGLSAVFPYGISAFISYEQVLGYADTDLATLSAGARLEF